MVEKVSAIHLEKVDSTNTYAKEHYKHFNQKELTRITADEQTAGRGRFKRTWVSPKEDNIYLTFYFTTPKGSDLNNYAQVLALSIAKMLDRAGVSPQIKWPNDLLIDGKKITGILCETVDLQDDWGVILGTGINVNMSKDACDAIDQPATSLLVETGKKHDKQELIHFLETFFLEDLRLYRQESFNPFYKAYEKLLTHLGKPITLSKGDESISGTLDSLNPDGRLNILLPNGEIKTVSSGDIKK